MNQESQPSEERPETKSSSEEVVNQDANQPRRNPWLLPAVILFLLLYGLAVFKWPKVAAAFLALTATLVGIFEKHLKDNAAATGRKDEVTKLWGLLGIIAFLTFGAALVSEFRDNRAKEAARQETETRHREQLNRIDTNVLITAKTLSVVQRQLLPVSMLSFELLLEPPKTNQTVLQVADALGAFWQVTIYAGGISQPNYRPELDVRVWRGTTNWPFRQILPPTEASPLFRSGSLDLLKQRTQHFDTLTNLVLKGALVRAANEDLQDPDAVLEGTQPALLHFNASLQYCALVYQPEGNRCLLHVSFAISTTSTNGWLSHAGPLGLNDFAGSRLVLQVHPQHRGGYEGEFPINRLIPVAAIAQFGRAPKCKLLLSNLTEDFRGYLAQAIVPNEESILTSDPDLFMQWSSLHLTP